MSAKHSAAKAHARRKSKGPLSDVAAHMHKGGLHETTGTPPGQKIPAAKLAAARAGKYGKKGVRQAILAATFAAHRP